MSHKFQCLGDRNRIYSQGQDQPSIHSEYQLSQNYLIRLCLQRNTTKQKPQTKNQIEFLSKSEINIKFKNLFQKKYQCHPLFFKALGPTAGLSGGAQPLPQTPVLYLKEAQDMSHQADIWSPHPSKAVSRQKWFTFSHYVTHILTGLLSWKSQIEFS